MDLYNSYKRYWQYMKKHKKCIRSQEDIIKFYSKYWQWEVNQVEAEALLYLTKNMISRLKKKQIKISYISARELADFRIIKTREFIISDLRKVLNDAKSYSVDMGRINDIILDVINQYKKLLHDGNFFGEEIQYVDYEGLSMLFEQGEWILYSDYEEYEEVWKNYANKINLFYLYYNEEYKLRS